MFKRLLLLLCIVSVAGPAWGQNSGSALRRTLPEPVLPQPREQAPESSDPAPNRTLQVDVADVALRRAVSQLMIITLEGTSQLTSGDRQMMDRYPPGGVILRTVSRPSFAADYITTLRKFAQARNPEAPLFIATDFFTLPRRDRMQRDRFVQLPSLLAIAAADDPESTRRFGAFLATQLSTIGFNMHLGPSLALAPVLPEAQGTVACLGSNADFAARAAEGIVASLDEAGIVCMPMDFPGGVHNRRQPGAPAVLLTSKRVLHDSDLLPYIRAAEAGAPMIHVSAVSTPTLDAADLPACLSPVVMRELLRTELGYDGVIVAGPLDSPDIARVMDVTEAAVLAFAGGADMLLWNSTGTPVAKAADRIVEAIKAGRLDQARILASVKRVAAVKARYNLAEQPMPEKRKALALESRKKYPDEAYELERRSITLLLNRNQTLPLNAEKSLPLLVTGVAGVEDLHGALRDTYRRKPVFIQPIVSARHAGKIESFEIDRITRNAVGLRTAVCVFATDDALEGQLEIVRKLRGRGVRVVVVLLGYPSTAHRFVEADALVLAYGNRVYVKETMRAVADILNGVAPVRVLAPVRDLETRVGHPESYNAYDVIQSPVGRLPISLEPPFVTGLSIPYPAADSVRRIEWDFGDGDRKRGDQVERVYKEPGRYPITLTVTDRNGESSSGTFYATVTP